MQTRMKKNITNDYNYVSKLIFLKKINAENIIIQAKGYMLKLLYLYVEMHKL